MNRLIVLLSERGTPVVVGWFAWIIFEHKP